MYEFGLIDRPLASESDLLRINSWNTFVEVRGPSGVTWEAGQGYIFDTYPQKFIIVSDRVKTGEFSFFTFGQLSTEENIFFDRTLKSVEIYIYNFPVHIFFGRLIETCYSSEIACS